VAPADEAVPQEEVAMRTIRDVMSGDIDVLRTTETAADAACFLASHGEDPAPLCLSDGSLAGTVSNRDIVTQVVAKGRDPRHVSLAEFAGGADLVALDIDIPLDDAVAIMCRRQRARLPVLEGERVVGVLSRRDVARSISFQAPWADD
jgi:CBS domain-containing protein